MDGAVFPPCNLTWDQTVIRVMAVILTAIDKAREFQKNIYFCLLTTRKPLTLWITTKCGKFFKRWEYQITISASWEICMQIKKQQLEPDMEQQFSSVQFSHSVMSDSLQPHGLQHTWLPCPEAAQTHVHWVGYAIQPAHPLSSLLLLPSIFPSIRVFSNESLLRIKWPKYCSVSFNISPPNESSGLISFRMHWFDLLEVWGTFQSLIQHHRSKASILQCLAFLYSNTHFHMTVGKTIPLTWQTFAGKVMSLLFNMLSRLEQQTRWKLAKEEVKAVYCPPAYLTYM